MAVDRSQGITLRQLRAFIAVANEQSFTKAAEVVGLTQPALTTCIRQLEDHAGVPLLERTTRKVRLNRFGSTFLPVAVRIQRDLELALRELEAMNEGTIGDISMAAVPSIASTILPIALAEFKALRPGVGITIAEDHSEGVRRKVLEGEVEFGLSGETEPFPDIEARPIFYDPVVLFCRIDHPLARLGRPLRWLDLAGREIFNMGYQAQIRSIIDVVPQMELSLSGTQYKVRNTLATLSLIRQGDTIAALPLFSIPADALTDVTFLPLAEPELRRDVYLCTDARTALSAPAREFVDHIRKNAADAGAVLYPWEG